MSRPVFDMNVFVEYEKILSEKDIAKMALSSVVLYELTATTIDKSRWQKYTAWRKFLKKMIYTLSLPQKIGGKHRKSPRVSGTARNLNLKEKLRKIRTRRDCKTIF